jgi:hypothetical protein
VSDSLGFKRFRRMVLGESLLPGRSWGTHGRGTVKVLKLACGHTWSIPGSRRTPRMIRCGECYLVDHKRQWKISGSKNHGTTTGT